ncbi:hypothetical protein ACE939_00235 [Aquimarina sp. W85]|uniref:hypothetical protein n=1 Tax=Aquimarina rhodophyticola TaxID=3342246 RepID=UPI003671397E
MNRIFLLLLFVLSCNFMIAQNSINTYKYVIVPQKFDFLKSENAYEVNALTKFLFEKYGFIAIMEGEVFPKDLIANGCLGLRTEVKKNSGLFTTKLVVVLKDCNAKIVFTSKEGKSRAKDFKKAYHEALRNAFESVSRLNYKYIEEAVAVDDIIKTPSTIDISNKESIQNDKELIENIFSLNLIHFTFNAKLYLLRKQPYGYSLEEKSKDKEIVIGKLYKTSIANSYMVRAGALSGHAFFDKEGNLILERVIESTHLLSKDTFARMKNN